MTQAYPDYQLPVILDFGMQPAVEGRSYPEIMRASLNQSSEPPRKQRPPHVVR